MTQTHNIQYLHTHNTYVSDDAYEGTECQNDELGLLQVNMTKTKQLATDSKKGRNEHDLRTKWEKRTNV